MRIEDLIGEFHPQSVLELEKEISMLHRAKGSSDYSKAVELLNQYVGGGTVYHYKADAKYGSWRVPRGFQLRSGYLRVVNPEKKNIVRDVLLEPIRVVFLSGSLPKSVMKVVNVGDGEDISLYPEGPSYAVLAYGEPAVVFRNARKRRVRCVLIYYMRAQDEEVQRTPNSLPDAVNYLSFPPYSSGEVAGFSLTYSEYKRLLQQAEKTLEIEAMLETDEGTGTLEVLESVAGDESGEYPILLTAHLCHPKPGGNDNASGAALLSEIVRVLRKCGFEKKVVALWIPEMYGTLAYFEEHPSNFLCGINLDMVGENQCLTGSCLDIVNSPWSLPSFIGELAGAALENPRFRRNEGHYTGGSDHYILTDSTFGCQFVSLTHWPDRFYHSSEDTFDKSDTRTLRWIGESVLEVIHALTFGIKGSLFNATKARIMSFYQKNNSNDAIVNNWLLYRQLKSLELLGKFGDASAEINFFRSQLNESLIPKGRKIKVYKGPIGDLWKGENEEYWEIQAEKKIPSIKDFLFEVLNFLEIGFSVDESVNISKSEFALCMDLRRETEFYMSKLKEKGLLKDI